jgi:hypothetical protein
MPNSKGNNEENDKQDVANNPANQDVANNPANTILEQHQVDVIVGTEEDNLPDNQDNVLIKSELPQESPNSNVSFSGKNDGKTDQGKSPTISVNSKPKSDKLEKARVLRSDNLLDAPELPIRPKNINTDKFDPQIQTASKSADSFSPSSKESPTKARKTEEKNSESIHTIDEIRGEGTPSAQKSTYSTPPPPPKETPIEVGSIANPAPARLIDENRGEGGIVPESTVLQSTNQTNTLNHVQDGSLDLPDIFINYELKSSFVDVPITKEIEYDFENFRKNDKAYNKLLPYVSALRKETENVPKLESLVQSTAALYDFLLKNDAFKKEIETILDTTTEGEETKQAAMNLMDDYRLNLELKNALILRYNEAIIDLESKLALYASSLQKLKSLNEEIAKLGIPSNRIFFKKAAEKKQAKLLKLKSDHEQLSNALASNIEALQLFSGRLQGKIHDLIKYEVNYLDIINSASLIERDKLYKLNKKTLVYSSKPKDNKIINKVNREQRLLLNIATADKGVFYYAYDPNYNKPYDYRDFSKKNSLYDFKDQDDIIKEKSKLKKLLAHKEKFEKKLLRNRADNEISNEKTEWIIAYQRYFYRELTSLYESSSAVFEERLDMLAVLDNKISSLKLEITNLSKPSQRLVFSYLINRWRKAKIAKIKKRLEQYENSLPALKDRCDAIREYLNDLKLHITASLKSKLTHLEFLTGQTSINEENHERQQSLEKLGVPILKRQYYKLDESQQIDNNLEKLKLIRKANVASNKRIEKLSRLQKNRKPIRG